MGSGDHCGEGGQTFHWWLRGRRLSWIEHYFAAKAGFNDVSEENITAVWTTQWKPPWPDLWISMVILNMSLSNKTRNWTFFAFFSIIVPILSVCSRKFLESENVFLKSQNFPACSLPGQVLKRRKHIQKISRLSWKTNYQNQNFFFFYLLKTLP